MNAQRACADCGTEDAGRRTRRLCLSCYDRHRLKVGDLADWPRRNYSRDELMAEYELLRGEGHTRRQIAARLGMTSEAFDRAWHRAKAAGDPRAVSWPRGGTA